MATRRLKPSLSLYFNPSTSDLSTRRVIHPLTSIVPYLPKLRLHPKKCRRQPKSPNSLFASFPTNPLILRILYERNPCTSKSRIDPKSKASLKVYNSKLSHLQMHHLFLFSLCIGFFSFLSNCTGSSLFLGGSRIGGSEVDFACEERRRLGFSQGSTRRQHPTGHQPWHLSFTVFKLRTQ